MNRLRAPIALLSLFGACSLAALHRGLDHPVIYNPGGVRGELDDGDLRWSAEQILERSGNADHETYLRMASDVLEKGRFLKYHISIWPPGMPLVAAAVLTVAGGEHYFLKLILVTCAAWALMIFALARLMPIGRSELLSLALYSSVLLLPAMRDWTFGFGSVMAEGIGCAIFMVALGALARALRTRERRWFVIAGLLLGIATYFRVYFRYAAEALLGLSAATIALPFIWKQVRAGLSWRQVLARLRPGPLDPEASSTWIDKRVVHYLLLGLVVFMLTLEPLRNYKLVTLGTRSLYVMSLKNRMAYVWATDDEVPAYVHGANPGCHVDPELCATVHAQKDELSNEAYRDLTLRTFFTHPFGWIWFKLKESDWLWFGRSWSELPDYPALLVEGFALALMGLAGFLWLILRYRRTRAPECLLLLLATTSFLLFNAALFSFFHYEWRYSQPLRLFAFLLPFFAWSYRDASGRFS